MLGPIHYVISFLPFIPYNLYIPYYHIKYNTREKWPIASNAAYAVILPFTYYILMHNGLFSCDECQELCSYYVWEDNFLIGAQFFLSKLQYLARYERNHDADFRCCIIILIIRDWSRLETSAVVQWRLWRQWRFRVLDNVFVRDMQHNKMQIKMWLNINKD